MTNNFLMHAAWVLTASFTLSLVYEFYRATVKKDISMHDNIRSFLLQGIPFYGIAAVIIFFLFKGYSWSAWVALIYCVILILVSIVYYNPVIMRDRKPGIIDWFEDLVYTGLLFAAAAILIYEITGRPAD